MLEQAASSAKFAVQTKVGPNPNPNAISLSLLHYIVYLLSINLSVSFNNPNPNPNLALILTHAISLSSYFNISSTHSRFTLLFLFQ